MLPPLTRTQQSRCPQLPNFINVSKQKINFETSYRYPFFSFPRAQKQKDYLNFKRESLRDDNKYSINGFTPVLGAYSFDVALCKK